MCVQGTGCGTVWLERDKGGAATVDGGSTETLLEEFDLPDVCEVVSYRKSAATFLSDSEFGAEEFRELVGSIYDARVKIAHVKQSFGALDLDRLIDNARQVVNAFPTHCQDLEMTLECLGSAPDNVVVKMPPSFILSDEDLTTPHLNNLPASDYAPDGGFVGRKDDLVRIEQLVLGDLHRVVTVSGAEGERNLVGN